MARPWNEEELEVVRRFLEEKGPRPVVREDLVSLATTLRRPEAGIKKKIMDLWAAGREEVPQGRIGRARSPVWGEGEVERLVRRYSEQAGDNKSLRIRNILAEFPGRTVSAMAKR